MTPHIDLVSEIRRQKSIIASLKISQSEAHERNMPYFDEKIRCEEKKLRKLQNKQKMQLAGKLMFYMIASLILLKVMFGIVSN